MAAVSRFSSLASMFARSAAVRSNTLMRSGNALRQQPALAVYASRYYSTVPSDRKYASSHEWCKVEGKVATVGITEHAANALGDVVYVDLPEVGSAFEQKDSFGAVESVKAASDVYAPIAGKVIDRNAELMDQPGMLNKDPHGEGWMIKIELSDPAQMDSLLDAAGYAKSIEE